MTPWMSRRVLDRELMDEETPSQAVADDVYQTLGAINRWLGGTRATLQRLHVLSREWPDGARIEVLDVACGGADSARAVVAWGRAHGFDIRVTALDISPVALDYARRHTTDPRLRFVCADMHRAPFYKASFHYIISTLFFHHLGDDQVVQTLRLFDRLATRGIVINDLIRRRRAYLWSWFVTRFRNAVVRHDGPLSVKRALRPSELAGLAKRAGLSWLTVTTHFGHRMTLAGERESG